MTEYLQVQLQNEFDPEIYIAELFDPPNPVAHAGQQARHQSLVHIALLSMIPGCGDRSILGAARCCQNFNGPE